MKTYILREPNSVEPQVARLLATPDPQTAALVERIVATGRKPALYVGLDVHTDSIAVSLAPSDSTEVRRYGLIGGTHDDVLRLAKQLAAAHPDRELRFGYEAGPHGYPLCRCLRASPATGSRPTAATPINWPQSTRRRSPTGIGRGFFRRPSLAPIPARAGGCVGDGTNRTFNGPSAKRAARRV